MPLPENIFILFYWTAPEGRVGCELFTEAIAAVDRTVCTGLERNFAGTAAGSAYSVKHLALAALAVVGSTFAGITAGFAALRLIGEALFSKNSCSLAVKVNSCPQSLQTIVLSWNMWYLFNLVRTSAIN